MMQVYRLKRVLTGVAYPQLAQRVMAVAFLPGSAQLCGFRRCGGAPAVSRGLRGCARLSCSCVSHFSESEKEGPAAEYDGEGPDFPKFGPWFFALCLHVPRRFMSSWITHQLTRQSRSSQGLEMLVVSSLRFCLMAVVSPKTRY